MADVSAKVAFSVSYCKTQSSTSSYDIILSGRLNIKEKREKFRTESMLCLKELSTRIQSNFSPKKNRKNMFLSPFFSEQVPSIFRFFQDCNSISELHVKKIKLRRHYTQKISKANPLKPTKWFLDVKLTHFHITINPWRPEDVKQTSFNLTQSTAWCSTSRFSIEKERFVKMLQ